MATPQVKDLVLHSPSGSTEVVTFAWPLQIGTGQDKHDNGIDIIDTIKFVCEELPSISSAFEEVNLNQINTACYETMSNLVERFNKAVDSLVALERGTSLPTERLNKYAHPNLLKHILQLVYNAAVLDPDKLNNYEPFSPEVYGETSYELVQQMIKHISISNDDTFVDLGSGVGQVVLQMAGSFPLKACIGIEKADTPAYYAERMDTIFRQYMAWFGKRYCEYKLLKGDFLIDEHREKITSSTLVFVNNFAFGPTVDHQLKERFADLRDGARVVSSKSFCPLNFRITDRNLSDIGTIMHVSEIPPEKGSVSWTCKPVSYYLHTIDRTKLEQYFQRLKTQKGAENENTGSTRTTRDRAKREANTGGYQNPLSNNSSNRTNSPANVNNPIKSKQQTSQQRNIDLETSTESDGDILSNANLSSSGPMTRKVWSDWCSSKDKSSQSDEDENISTNTRIVRNTRTIQKKRKKLTRKAAIASKNSTAAQRVAVGRERDNTKSAGTADAGKDENEIANNLHANKGRKGRLGKRARGRKSLKIIGLDLLHKHTLVSTSVEALCRKMPPAPGIIDHQLTSLLTGNMSHIELDIPEAPKDTPYALQILLDVFRSQYMAMIEQMKSKSFVPCIQQLIRQERDRTQRIKNRTSQLDKQIKVLIDDSVALLKIRMNELGINVNSPNDLIAKAKEIVGRHKELQGMAIKIQTQVTKNEMEQKTLLRNQLENLPEFQRLFVSNGITKFEEGFELSEAAARELVLKELANTLAHHKKLKAQVSIIEKENVMLEKSNNELKTSAALLAQGTQMTANDNSLAAMITPNTAQQQHHTPHTYAHAAYNAQATTAVVGMAQKTSTNLKGNRRNRDHSVRSQEWPDVPDVGKIEESNPEVLAQKILETGRQIEAGKLTITANSKQTATHEDKRAHKYSRQTSAIADHGESSCINFSTAQQNVTSVNANLLQKQQNFINVSLYTNPPKCEMPIGQKSLTTCANNTVQESPKVANFEDRLKSIIETALNEDQKHRKSLREELPSPQQKVTSKRNTTSTNQQKTGALPPQIANSHSQTNPTMGAPNSAHFSTAMLSKISPTQTVAVSVANLNTAAQYAKITPTDHDANNMTSAFYRKHTTNELQQMHVTKYHVAELQDEQTAQQHAHANSANQFKYAYLTNTNTGGKEPIPTDFVVNHRHSDLTPNEMFVAQHKQQLQHAAIESTTAMNQYNFATLHATSTPQNILEFKTPSMCSENVQRCNSRDIGTNEDILPRSGSASSDSAIAYLLPTRDRQITQERSVSRESAGFQYQQNQMVNYPNRPSSNSSQPDYTQVSPAKIALRRHLSQEKLNQLSSNPSASSPGTLPLSTKTIGDLVNGEIERTLEISHQSIINAAVNMSTVGSSLSTGGNYMDAHVFAERERSRMNKQAMHSKVPRAERGHVRMPEDLSDRFNVATNAMPVASNMHNFSTDTKSPNYQNTVAMMYSGNHKAIKADEQLTVVNNSKLCSPVESPRSRANYKNVNSDEYSMSVNQLATNAAKTQLNNQSSVSLPRAEMKGCIEAYFGAEDQHRQQQQHQLNHKQLTQYHKANYVKERNPGNLRNSRGNSVNPPLEGLAASLQSHLLNARKQEERQRRAGAAAPTSALTNTSSGNAAKYEYADGIEMHEQSRINSYKAADCSTHNYNEERPVKIEIGVKRTSPSTAIRDHTHPSKFAHYAHDSTMMSQQHNQLSHAISESNIAKNAANQYNNKNNGVKSHMLSPSTTYYSSRQRKMALEPLLISPEVNAIMNDERSQSFHSSTTSTTTNSPFAMRQQQSNCNNSSVNTVSGRVSGPSTAGDDDAPIDDVNADDETHWQHCVSSNFDRLIAFASTELDKTRRSIDADIVPSSLSCNTSPDSGITHSSNNSDAGRIFVSTGGLSQQLEINAVKNDRIGGHISACGSFNSKNQNNLTRKSANIISNTNASSFPDKLKTLNSSNVNANIDESPLLLDTGLPRTPSPAAALIDGTVSAMRDTPDSLKAIGTNNLKIPLKYQRKSKNLEKHYKKKFCERNWDYDCEDIIDAPCNSNALVQSESALCENALYFSSSSTSTKAAPTSVNADDIEREIHMTSASQSSTVSSHHKSSKFRPKGKDWDWSLDSSNCGVKNRIDTSSSISYAKATTNIN